MCRCRSATAAVSGGAAAGALVPPSVWLSVEGYFAPIAHSACSCVCCRSRRPPRPRSRAACCAAAAQPGATSASASSPSHRPCHTKNRRVRSPPNRLEATKPSKWRTLSAGCGYAAGQRADSREQRAAQLQAESMCCRRCRLATAPGTWLMEVPRARPPGAGAACPPAVRPPS